MLQYVLCWFYQCDWLLSPVFQTFDRYRCARLVMECLCQFLDPSMNRMSVAICSILAAKVRFLAHNVKCRTFQLYLSVENYVKEKNLFLLFFIQLIKVMLGAWSIFMHLPPPPLKKEAYCFATVSWSVCRSVDLLTPSLNQYQTWCKGCPQWVDDPYSQFRHVNHSEISDQSDRF